MERSTNTGWRALTPAAVAAAPHYETADKKELFRIARLAAEALKLPPACRFLLEQLCGFYGGETIMGKLVVWPSNEMLQDRSGLAERTIRYAAAWLMREGLLGARDSANGKRFARRNPAGQIVDAYGFDLSPLLARADELQQRVQALREARKARKATFDALTVHRRAAREVILTIVEWFPELDVSELEARYDELSRITPRRSSPAPVAPILAAWEALRFEAESRYHAACGGKDRRHKDQNNDAPDQSWKQGHEEVGAGARSAVEPMDLREACPDAWGYTRGVRTVNDLVGEAGRLRGAIGVHASAWDEALESVGPVRAAVLLMIVLQTDADAQRAGEVIKSPGGYFRFYVRKLASGELHLEEEVARMRRRRSN